MQQGIKTDSLGKRLITPIVILSMLLIYLCGMATAEVYKWVDNNGEVHITDSPPPDAKSSGEIKVYKDNPQDNQNAAPATETNREESSPSFERKKTSEVVLYTTSWCPYCRKARDYLRSRGIDFTEYDIEKDEEAAIRKKQLDGRGGVPFAVINGRPIRGFSAPAYDRALQE